jgi:hypothetical protein
MKKNLPYKKRFYKMTDMSKTVGGVYKKLNKKYAFDFISLSENWDQIIGEDYSKILTLVKVGKNNITVLSKRNFATEANYIAPVLIEKINSFTGNNHLQKIKFIFGTGIVGLLHKNTEKEVVLDEKDMQKLNKDIEVCSDEGLKNALKELGKNIIGHKDGK